MFKSFKNLLGLSLLAFFGVWMGCSSDSSPVSPSNKAVTDDGTATQVSTFTVSTEVSIPDDSLRVAVTQELWHLSAAGKLDIPTGSNPLTTANLAKIKVLKAVGKGIADLRGLEHATNLDTLILRGNQITNVDSLAGLTGLVWLDLSRNQITDATPLAGLRDLEALHLYYNQFGGGHSVSSLNGLTKLKRFGIGQGQFGSDIVNPLLANMTDLEWLRVNGANISNLNFLEKLKKLEFLNISANGRIEDLSLLACLPKLTELRIHNMPIVGDAAIGYDKHILYLHSKGVTVWIAGFSTLQP